MQTLQLVISNQVHEVAIKEYCGQRVVTLKDIDRLHQRKDGAARKAFNSYKDQFIENEDYFVLNTDEAYKMFGIKAPNGIILITESGYPMVIKTFSDDLSWQVHRQLVKAYFKIKQTSQQQIVPTSQEDILIFALQNQKEMKQRLEQLEKDNRQLSLMVDNEIILTKHQRAEIQQAVNRRQGELNREGYTHAHFHGIYTTLKSHFNVPNYSEIKRTDFEKALKIIAGWYPKRNEENQEGK